MFTIFLIALSLSIDSFVTAGSLSLKHNKNFWLMSLWIASVFAFFQSLMPLLGFLLGKQFVIYVQDFDHWLAFVLLLLIGIKFIMEAFATEDKKIKNITFKILVTLGIATSIDALVVGLTFAFIEINLFLALSIIAIVTFIISLLGCALGKKLSHKFGKKIEVLAGIALILIGVKILVTHLFLI